MTYAADELLDEVAYVAFHYCWTMEAVLDLEHGDRQYFIERLQTLVQIEE